MLHIEEELVLLVQAADVVADARFTASLAWNLHASLILWITSMVGTHRRGKKGERRCGNVT
jgi:hypothetical protein